MATDHADDPLGALLAVQHGMVSRRQCRDFGLTDAAIRHRLARRRWQHVFPRVFATFDGPVPRDALITAALLYAGTDAVLSHDTAAALWGLLPATDSTVHVTVPISRKVRPAAGLVVHRTRHVDAHPVARPSRTRIERTAADLVHDALDADAVVHILCEAVRTRRTTPDRLREELQLRPTLRWRTLALDVLGHTAVGVHSPLEVRFLRVERSHGLPLGTRQSRVARAGGTQWTDVAYVAQRVRLELDGRLGHETTFDRWRDMDRDNAGAEEGWLTVRYGWHDLVSRPCEVAAQLARVLLQRGWDGSPRKCGNGCAL
jgi:very-short-patch-repair endonuclease